MKTIINPITLNYEYDPQWPCKHNFFFRLLALGPKREAQPPWSLFMIELTAGTLWISFCGLRLKPFHYRKALDKK